MIENIHFEQKFGSGTAKNIYRVRYVTIQLMKWMAYYDQYYKNINYFDLMGSVISYLNERSEY